MAAPDQMAPIEGEGVGRRLDFAWLELTHACNLRCAQCYTHSTPQTPHQSLPTSRWLSLLDEIAVAGGVAVQFTGGEATAHPDWRELIEHASHRGLSVELFTNGTTLEESDLDFLGRLGVSLAISLHSHLPAVHDRITGVEGSFVATLETVRAACAHGLHLRVAGVLLEENAAHGPQVEALVRRQGVLTPVSLDPVRPTGRGRTASAPGAAAACTGCRSSGYAVFHGAPGRQENRAQATCWDGKIAIDPEGRVTPCIFSRSAVVGSVAEDPLPKVLARGPLAELWGLTVDDVEACRDCDRKAECFDCRALPLSVLGDLRAKNPRCDYQPPAATTGVASEEHLRPAPSLETYACGEDRLLLDRPAGRMHVLNWAAAWLLEALAEGEDLETASRKLARETQADPEVVRRDLEVASREMLAAGLLRSGEEATLSESEVHWPDAPIDPLEIAGSNRGLPRTGGESAPEILAALPQLRGVVYLESSAAAWQILGPWLSAHALADSGATGDAPILGWIQVHTRRPDPAAFDRHYVLVDGFPEGDALFPAGLRSLVETAWCALGEREGEGPPRFHAAAVSGAAGAILIPGESGRGKSLLCAHAVAAGADYLSDEMASWSPISGGVEGLPKPVTIKGEGAALLPPALASGLSPLDPADEDRMRWLSLPAGASGPLRAVVIPQRDSDAGLSPLLAVEGAAELLQNCFDLPGLAAPVISELVAACQSVPFYTLGTSCLPDAGRQLASLVHTRSRG